jgi:hypothetical protein
MSLRYSLMIQKIVLKNNKNIAHTIRRSLTSHLDRSIRPVVIVEVRDENVRDVTDLTY